MYKVLVIDDDANTGSIVAGLLVQLGCEIAGETEQTYKLIKQTYEDCNLITDKPDGWYRKSDKQSKKRNLKR